MVDIDTSVLPKQEPIKVSGPDSPVLDSGFDSRFPIITNDWMMVWTTGEPGDVIDWHRHMPEMDQIHVTIQGRKRWTYIDDDGEERQIEAGPAEFVYLPGGLKHKVEIIGDEPHIHVGLLRNTIPRVEQLLGVEGRKYDPTEIPVGVRFDDVRDEIIRMDEDAVLAIGGELTAPPDDGSS